MSRLKRSLCFIRLPYALSLLSSLVFSWNIGTAQESNMPPTLEAPSLDWSPAPPKPIEPDTVRSKSERELLAVSILRTHCLTCHNDRNAEGGYNLSRLSRISKPGDSGASPFVAGNAGDSELVKRIESSDEAIRMPSGSAKLSNDDANLIRDWVNSHSGFADDDDRLLIDLTGSDTTPLVLTNPPVLATYSKNVPSPKSAIDWAQNRLYVAGLSEVIVWDMETRSMIARWTGFGRYISSIQIDSNGDYIAIASGAPSRSGTIHLVDLKRPAMARPILYFSDVPVAMMFSPKAPILAIGAMDGSVKLFDVVLNQQTMDVAAHADQVLSIAWRANGSQFITGSRDRTARIYEYPSMELKLAYSSHERAVGAVGISDLGALTLDETGTLRLWAIGDSERILTTRTGLPPRLNTLHCSAENSVSWLGNNAIETLQIQRKEIEQGKEEDGKPKKKKVFEFTDFKRAEMNSNSVSSWTKSPDGGVFYYINRDGKMESVGGKSPSTSWRVYP